MKNILIAGAGKSSISLIKYILTHAPQNNWKIVVMDGSLEAITEKTGNDPNATPAVVDVTNDAERQPLVQNADIVISLMPPHLHYYLAKDCLQFKKNLITSSYVSPEIRAMNQDVKAAGLMFMCEMGLDPGIDHMTASKLIHEIRNNNGTLTAFKSYCGGLIAPESDDNPWHYKFSWNPKNIVTAGMDGGRFLEDGQEVKVPYEEMFDHNKQIAVPGLDNLAYYPNRDSIPYLEKYDIAEVKTFMRATLRHPEFCVGWKAVQQLGLTSSKDVYPPETSYEAWLKSHLGLENELLSPRNYIINNPEITESAKVADMFQWLGLFSEDPTGVDGSSADILLDALLKSWEMNPKDKDMVVMHHELEYINNNTPAAMTSTMVIKGENRNYSAMAKTVGLPMGILARLMLQGKIDAPKGVCIPNMPEVYHPVLDELEHHGIKFHDVVL